MCKFMSAFPKHSDIIGAPRRNQNLEMFLQPCKDDKTYYRVRLLAFQSKDGKRKDPHITRMVHKAWVTDPKTGKKRLEKVVCSKGTPWIETEGPKASSCKICNYAGQQWTIYNESGKSDTIARTNASNATSSFEAIVPVYVRNDPNYDRNNGKFKVIVINDRELYKTFREKINLKLDEDVEVFNGGHAVDCLIHVGSELVEGKNGKTFKKIGIDKIKFSTEPREIPAINSKSIDAFPFDDTYYVSSDDEEIDAFYSAHCAISNDDIPEDDDIPVYKSDKNEKSTQKVSIPSNDNSSNDDDINDDAIDDIIDRKSEKTTDGYSSGIAFDDDEVDTVTATEETTTEKKSDDIDSEDLLKELGL